MNRDEEELHLEQPMRGQELLVNSPRDAGRSRRRWRERLIIGASVFIMSILLGSLTDRVNRGRSAAPIFAMILAAADDSMTVEELRVKNDEHMRYFLMGPRSKPAPKEGYRLLLVLPGGDGSEEFRPFIESVAAEALSKDYLVAQLVAPKWDGSAEIVWPIAPDRAARPPVLSEAFIDAVVADVANMHKLDAKHVYALGWSSSGPAVYSAAMRPKTPLTGAFVAMSVFHPQRYPAPANARGRAFYILHSPQDFIRMTFPENARKQLAGAGATVKLQTYQGGHGWHGNPHKMIRAGVTWLESQGTKATTRPTAATTRAAASPAGP